MLNHLNQILETSAPVDTLVEDWPVDAFSVRLLVEDSCKSGACDGDISPALNFW